MAVMVAASRLAGAIHTRIEVTLGAVLGSGLTFLIFGVFSVTFK